MNRSTWRTTLAVLLMLAGTAGAAGDELAAAIARIDADEPRNRVLNQLQAGSLAFDLGQREQAELLFDNALTGITAVYAGSEQAAAARSLWQDEGSKDFKGEPYERAMAFYYRGLLDMLAGDYENARASFKSGLLQDAFAEDAQHRADFALLMFLEAWSSHQLGAESLATERFAELQEFRPDFPLPPADHDLVVIVETGKAPRKLQDGIGGNLLVYRRGKRFQEQGAQMRVAGATMRLWPMESIYWQASTRGGRPIDGILEGQIQFKQTTTTAASTVAGIASESSVYAPLFGASGAAFAGVAGVAGLASLATSGITARADNRYWNNLPDMVHVLTLPKPDGADQVAIEFLDRHGRILPELTRTAPIVTDVEGRSVVWTRARRATDVDTPQRSH